MASWMAFYRVNSAAESDPALCWQMGDMILSPDDALNHNRLMFRHFADLNHGLPTSAPLLENLNRGQAPQTCNIGANLTPHPSSSSSSSADKSASSAVSSTDEPDFLPAVSADFTPHQLHQMPHLSGLKQPLKHHVLGRASSNSLLFDSALQRFGEVSLHSPVRMEATAVALHPPISPTPRSNSTDKRQSKKIVDAISSTIKRATHLRRGKKQAQTQVQVQAQSAAQRSASPTSEHPPVAIKERKERAVGVSGANTSSSIPMSLPYNHSHYSQSANFIHGYYDDPFGDYLQTNPSAGMGFLSHNGNGIDDNYLKSELETYQTTGGFSPRTVMDTEAIVSDLASEDWHSQHLVATSLAAEQWAGSAVAGYPSSHEPEWWNGMDVFSEAKTPQTSHHALQPQQLDMPFSYDFVPPMLDNVVMTSVPGSASVHERPAQVQQAYPPPPPPPPIPTTKERGRSNRPPKARSSGARHQNPSPSPLRKTRGPSASPKPRGQSQLQGQVSAHQRRHSSTGSISSARSASGRVTGASAPGTPGGHGIRKRRSRDAGLLCSTGGDDMGFVNFTPNDGSILMTGVAPSGSSKTKARREKEAQERRRKLSEAAMKAVVAAGGDVDKLIQEGFAI